MEKLDLDTKLKKIKDAGYDGIEIGIPFHTREQNELRKGLEKYELLVIAHQYQAEGELFENYASSFRKSLENSASFNPLLINSHTGKDYWEKKQNLLLVDIGEDVAQKFNVTVAHETHRGRFLYSAPVAKEYFTLRPGLKINADFSHWACVSESLLDDQEEVVEEAIQRSEHIHARVGHPQGPQISDPRAPEWGNEMRIFTGWWKRIVQKFIVEKRPFLTITPEFGPVPYMGTLPFTNKPVGDQWEINTYMKNYLKNEFSDLFD